MKLDLSTNKLIRDEQPPAVEAPQRPPVERLVATRLATEADVPAGSILSDAMLARIRDGQVGLKGFAPRLLGVLDQRRIAAAMSKRARRGAYPS